MKKMNTYQVSALIVSYKPNYDKILMTIKSLLLQKDISLQIVIADDGSDIDYFKEIESFFKMVDYGDYCLVKNRVNQGTVKNFISGLSKCQGDYIKPISPGDYMAHDCVLKNWLAFMEVERYGVSGSNYLCYSYGTNKEILPQKCQLVPVLVNLRPEHMRLNYIFNEDVFVGASMLCRKDLLVEYISLIMDKVVYAEDCCYRLMVFNGEKLGFYPHETILYEIGTGISTSRNEKWQKLIGKDYAATNEIMLHMNSADKQLREQFEFYLKAKQKGGLKKVLLYFKISGLVQLKAKKKFIRRYSDEKLDYDWIHYLEQKTFESDAN